MTDSVEACFICSEISVQQLYRLFFYKAVELVSVEKIICKQPPCFRFLFLFHAFNYDFFSLQMASFTGNPETVAPPQDYGVSQGTYEQYAQPDNEYDQREETIKG